MDDERLRWGILGLGVIGALLLIAFALGSSGELEGRNWVVDELSIGGSPTPPAEGATITALFEDGVVSGISGCNSYSGGYETDGGSISFGPIATTLMACEGTLLDQEQLYLSLLAESDSYVVEGDTLTLRSSGTVLVSYTSD